MFGKRERPAWYQRQLRRRPIPEVLISKRRYATQEIVDYVAQICPTHYRRIWYTVTAIKSISMTRQISRACNRIERFFKQCRRVAARHDKLAANYLAFVQQLSWLGSFCENFRRSASRPDDHGCSNGSNLLIGKSSTFVNSRKARISQHKCWNPILINHYQNDSSKLPGSFHRTVGENRTIEVRPAGPEDSPILSIPRNFIEVERGDHDVRRPLIRLHGFGPGMIGDE